MRRRTKTVLNSSLMVFLNVRSAINHLQPHFDVFCSLVRLRPHTFIALKQESAACQKVVLQVED